MRVGVFEWFSCLPKVSPELESLRHEGLAMLGCLVNVLKPLAEVRAIVAADLVNQFVADGAVDSCDVATYSGGERPDQILASWQQVCQTVDYGWVVAPEFDGLLQRATEALRGHTTLIACSHDFIAKASDKWLTAEALAGAGVPHPVTYRLSSASSALAEYPLVKTWVCKRLDGAGCDQIRLIDREQLPVYASGNDNGSLILQPWLTGEHYSASFLAGRDSLARIGAAHQRISEQQDAVDLIGLARAETVPDKDRMWSTAEAALHALGPPGLGWIGVDMLYEAETNSWYVIEVNPRCTSSIELFAQDGQLTKCVSEVIEAGPYSSAE